MVRKKDIIEILRDHIFSFYPCMKDVHFFVIMGASGDLAKKKIYPALWMLFRDGLLPKETIFVGYARSDLTIDTIRDELKKHTTISDNYKTKFKKFIRRNHYLKGNYTDAEQIRNLRKKLDAFTCNAASAHVTFYLALPPFVYMSVSALISLNCRPKPPGCLKLIVEKPFGHDLQSSDALDANLRKYFKESELYRIDHYLGKEMVQSLLMLRFANGIFTRVWNRDSIASVMITFKEKIGTYGRAGYFDEYGIIRDVMQNHLLQILTIVAMEPPVGLDADLIRDEKVKILRSINPIKFHDVVIGQYVGDPDGRTEESRTSYTDDPKIKKDSCTPTYACVVMYIENERWADVPFILKCGKAMNEHKTEVRVQFKDAPLVHLFEKNDIAIARNEFVLRIQPNESIHMNITNKNPGREFVPHGTELDLTYNERYSIKLPEAYERLLMDVFAGVQSNFVRSDELHEAWRIFTPVLEHLKNVKPFQYKFGVRGLHQADELCSRVGYVYSRNDKCPSHRSL